MNSYKDTLSPPATAALVTARIFRVLGHRESSEQPELLGCLSWAQLPVEGGGRQEWGPRLCSRVPGASRDHGKIESRPSSQSPAVPSRGSTLDQLEAQRLRRLSQRAGPRPDGQWCWGLQDDPQTLCRMPSPSSPSLGTRGVALVSPGSVRSRMWKDVRGFSWAHDQTVMPWVMPTLWLGPGAQSLHLCE